MFSLPFLGGQTKIEPRHDAWPPTWRLPSGAIRVEALFKEPGRQKLVDKATKATACAALALIVLAHDQWPWLTMVNFVQNVMVGSDPHTFVEHVAAWLFVGSAGVGLIVGTFRMVLSAAGVDQGRMAFEFSREHLFVDSRVFELQDIKGFELESHRFGKIEGHSEKRLGHATNLYYRDAYSIIMTYGNRRIELAEVLGRSSASSLLARLQDLSTKKKFSSEDSQGCTYSSRM